MQANLVDSRAQIKVACENLVVGTDFHSPTANRQALNLRPFLL